jgi:hypothetical protein
MHCAPQMRETTARYWLSYGRDSRLSYGMMHAPAAGRAIAELVAHGRYQTIDLGRLGYERVEAGEPYAEEGIL